MEDTLCSQRYLRQSNTSKLHIHSIVYSLCRVTADVSSLIIFDGINSSKYTNTNQPELLNPLYVSHYRPQDNGLTRDRFPIERLTFVREKRLR